jgi:hypothetical protein
MPVLPERRQSSKGGCSNQRGMRLKILPSLASITGLIWIADSPCGLRDETFSGKHVPRFGKEHRGFLQSHGSTLYYRSFYSVNFINFIGKYFA